MVHIHGGGFSGGHKDKLRASIIDQCRAAGISLAAINYRLSQHAPFPAQMMDAARAIQFLRFHAGRWNLDPSRVGATGGSAGAGISLWLGYHDDLADASNSDPVLRQSTKLTCVGVINAQSSYDPRFILEHLRSPAKDHAWLLPFFGLKAEELETARARRLFEEASLINFVSRHSPPTLLFYSFPNRPITPQTTPSEAIHHPIFGQLLQAKLAARGVECILHYGEDVPGETKDDKIANHDPQLIAFFRRHLGAE